MFHIRKMDGAVTDLLCPDPSGSVHGLFLPEMSAIKLYSKLFWASHLPTPRALAASHVSNNNSACGLPTRVSTNCTMPAKVFPLPLMQLSSLAPRHGKFPEDQ